jgi:hypothetical protein
VLPPGAWANAGAANIPSRQPPTTASDARVFTVSLRPMFCMLPAFQKSFENSLILCRTKVQGCQAFECAEFHTWVRCVEGLRMFKKRGDFRSVVSRLLASQFPD